MALHLWQLLCVLFCLFNLFVLYEESKLVIFKNLNKNLSLQDHKFSFCLSLTELIQSGHFEENETFTPKQLIDQVVASLLAGNEDGLLLSSSLVRHHHICIDFDPEKFHRIFANISTFQFKILLYVGNDTLHYFFENIYKHNGLESGNFTLFVFVQNVLLLPAPFETNCTRTWFDGHKIYKKPFCLSNCYKERANSTFFLYRYDESTQLTLNKKELEIIERCHEACRPADCFVKTFYRRLIFQRDKNEAPLPRIELENVWTNAVPNLSGFSFAVHFVGLCVLFANISFYEILVSFARLMNRRFHRLFSLLNGQVSFLFASNYVALALCVSLLALQTAFSLVDYLRFEFYTREHYGLANIVPATIFICLPVQLAYTNVTGDLLKQENGSAFLGNSLFEIKRDTNVAFGRLISDSYLRKGNVQIPYQIEMGPEMIFKMEAFEEQGRLEKRLARCARIDLNVSEHKFETYLGNTQLLIELNHADFTVYRTVFGRRLVSSSVRIHRNIQLFARKTTRLANPYNSSCWNYEERSENGCLDRENCIDECYNMCFYGNHSSLSLESVIYGQSFNDSVLSKARLSTNEDRNIRLDCERLYRHPNCQQVTFEEAFEQIEFFEDQRRAKQITIELYMHSANQVEIEQLTLAKLLLDILNIECILIGLNANRLLRIAIDWIRRSLRIRNRLKPFGLLIVLLSLAGFAVHSTLIFKQILTSALVRSESFERLMKMDSANFVICFDIDLTQLDEHEKLTGNYFERLTSNLTVESVFDKFEILDERLKASSIEPKDLERHKEKIAISTAFMFNLKCFFFSTNISYLEQDLFKLEEIFSVKVYFKDHLYSPACSCFKIYLAFYENKKGSFEKLESYYPRKDQTSSLKSTFTIQPVMIEFDSFDRFYYIQKPLALFREQSHLNDDLLYFRSLLLNFRRITNCSTQFARLSEGDHDLFELEINDALLVQYFFQRQQELDESGYINPNYNVNVFSLITITSHQKVESNASDITIIPNMYKQKIMITNESNFAKLLINVLNTSTLWFSTSVLDLDSHLLKFLALFKRLYDTLLNLEKLLRPNRFIA